MPTNSGGRLVSALQANEREEIGGVADTTTGLCICNLASLKTVPTFPEVLAFLDAWTSPASLEVDECRAYYDLIQGLPDGATILEVGSQYGRSSAIAVLLNRNFQLHFIDAWTGPDGQDIKQSWLAMMGTLADDAPDLRYKLYPVLSNNPFLPVLAVDLLLIDADHTEPWVINDCNRFLPMVKPRGYACFHDYGRTDTNAVEGVVNSHPLVNRVFDRVSLVGTLLILRRHEISHRQPDLRSV